MKIGKEINLLSKYPISHRNLSERNEGKSTRSIEIAREFGFDYFDGDRKHGYGGFFYSPRYWTGVIQDLINYYELTNSSRVLDVGCAKGFFLYDLTLALPGVDITGIDVSTYAIENSIPQVRDKLKVGNATHLEFPDKSFDFVISINTIHNLKYGECAKALAEIQRVCRQSSFITVDAYRNEEERKRMADWNLTAQTIMSVEEWKKFFAESGYTGDFFWFIP